MTDEAAAEATQGLTLTDAAIAKAAHLLSAQESGLALRVEVRPGGCAGLRYQLYFTDEYKHAVRWELAQADDEGFSEPEGEEAAAERALLAQRNDTLVWFGRVPVLIDAKSYPYLPGATLDYLDTLQKSGFTIDNPNAVGSCACGDSFH
jgi:Fe-S cluster assembly iron-binding protein IscA